MCFQLRWKPTSLSCQPGSDYPLLLNTEVLGWWRLRESNPWPPACKAGALPAELNPRFFFQGPRSRILCPEFLIFEAPSKLNSFLFPELTFWECVIHSRVFLRKEVIQPHLPIRLPCYDLTPIIDPTFDDVLLAVRLSASGVANSHGLTGGVYKARERIHRGMLIRDY